MSLRARAFRNLGLLSSLESRLPKGRHPAAAGARTNAVSSGGLISGYLPPQLAKLPPAICVMGCDNAVKCNCKHLLVLRYNIMRQKLHSGRKLFSVKLFSRELGSAQWRLMPQRLVVITHGNLERRKAQRTRDPLYPSVLIARLRAGGAGMRCARNELGEVCSPPLYQACGDLLARLFFSRCPCSGPRRLPAPRSRRLAPWQQPPR